MADTNRPPFFGLSAPRSLETFGVAGVLGEKSKVFYSSIFATKHVGRVTDLIAAKLGGEGLDELRLRALLLFGVFEAFRAQGVVPDDASKQKLAEPLVVECGLDEDRIALGVAFTTDEKHFPKLEGLVGRIDSAKPVGEFETLLSEINAHAHWTVVRTQKAIRRVEIVMVLGIAKRIDEDLLKNKPALKIVEIPKEQKADPPKVKAYVELGDLDYPEMLKDEASVKDGPAPATGEVLVHGIKEADDAVKVRAAHLLQAMGGKHIGGDRNVDGSTVVRGSRAGEPDSDSVKITSGGAIEVDDLALVVKGGSKKARKLGLKTYGVDGPPGDDELSDDEDDNADDETSEEGDEEDSDTTVVREKKKKKKKKKLDSADGESQGDDDEADEAEADEEGEEEGESGPGAGVAIKEMIEKVKNAWTFGFARKRRKKKKKGLDGSRSGQGEEDEEEDDVDESSDKVSQKAETGDAAEEQGENSASDSKGRESTSKGGASKSEAVAKESRSGDAPSSGKEYDDDNESSITIPAAQPIKISTADIEKEALKLTREIETGIEKTVNRAQAESGDVKKEMGSTRAKRWVDGLMSELVAEKAQLAEASKALNASIRQKEIEFRNKELILTEELKRRDDMIRQKNNALSRAKEQLSQVSISAERLKSAKVGATDDAHYKQKYGMVQKILNTTKEENSELHEKIEDLRGQLKSLQLTAKRTGPTAPEYSTLQIKFERQLKATEEFKKMNQQLSEKLNEAKKERLVAAPQEEVKKRLEAAMKVANNHQRESEKLKLRVEEMNREQMRLQGELNKAAQLIKAARAASKAQAAAAAQANAAAAAAADAVLAAKPAAAALATGAAPAAPKPAVAPIAAVAPPPSGSAKPAVSPDKPGTGGKSNPPKAA